MDNLFNQMANISKAHGYNILADQVKDLKEALRDMILLHETNEGRKLTPEYEAKVKKAKLLSI